MRLRGYLGQWFAIHVRPKSESFVAAVLRNKGYESFLPMSVSWRTATNRSKGVRRPLFPGYLFCRFDTPAHALLMTTPGVVRIVGYGNTPSVVDENEILALKTIAETGAPVAHWPRLETGDRVRIISGPLSGIEGVLCYFNKRDRLVVSVTLLQRSALVELKQDWVMRAVAGTGLGVSPASNR